MASLKKDALDYHRNGRPGKIEVVPSKPLTTQKHLSLAYTPGVAEACREIHRDPMTVFELTARGNLVAVVSNGTAILGLGHLGPSASKPVMEGKGVLFKRFADVDVFDIELDTTDPQEIIRTCKLMEPTFGGINLEDIKAPECFEIEETLIREMNIPVFHDDQHGTAIITGAAIINACEVTGQKIEDLKVVIVGAGAAGISCTKFWAKMGVKHENIVMFDINGLLYAGREDLNKYQAEFATKRKDIKTIEDALNGANVLLGLSAAGAVKAEWLKGMAPDPIIFAMANPVPEVMPEEVKAVRPDAIMGTGRSDYPNQVNNVLGFPFIFRGALDVAATVINEEMKMAATKSLADLAHEPVPESVLRAYGVEAIEYGREYLIPKPLDPRVLLWEAPAVAQAAMETGVAQRQIDLDEYRDMLIARQGPGRLMRNNILHYAQAGKTQRVVYPEGEEAKIIYAAYQVHREGIAEPILLGKPAIIEKKIAEMGLDFSPQILTPYSDCEYLERYTQEFFKLRQRKGMSAIVAERRMRSRTNYGLMMVKMGDADAIVNGLTHEYAQVIRPAFEVFKTKKGVSKASGVYLMIAQEKVYVFADATVNMNPSAACLAEIAILAADFAQSLTLKPRVAVLSHSNFGSTRTEQTDKARRAVELVRERRPDILIDGEMQADTAVVSEIIDERYPFSQVKDANVLIFPNLTSANVSYKLLDRLSSVEAIGPILLGLEASVHVLQTGAEVDDIVAMTAVAVMDAQSRIEA
jgi:malate dehydrogenase (oxaloacetate-decarboxylating)(NADP+)